MKRSTMERRGIRQVVARKLALRFTHNIYKPGHGEVHLRSADSMAEFETNSMKGMVYWPILGGMSVVVSFALPDGTCDMYELTAEEIVQAAIRWRTKREAATLAPTSNSAPLLPEVVDVDEVAHGNLGVSGAFQGPLPPPELPQDAE